MKKNRRNYYFKKRVLANYLLTTQEKIKIPLSYLLTQKEYQTIMKYKKPNTLYFTYSAYTDCDEHGFILDVIVTPDNRHDNQMAPDLVAAICTKFLAIHTVAVDAGY